MKNYRGHPAAGWICLSLLTLGLTVSVQAQSPKIKDTLRFATGMAKDGNWREAQYRWQLVLDRQPDNPRVLNNLAVAAEALGEIEAADELYEKALKISNADSRIEDNHRRFERYREEVKRRQSAGVEEDPEEPVAELSRGSSEIKKGKVLRVAVGLSLPPRLKLEGQERLLVASFQSEESDLFNLNRELTRFLRNKFRRASTLDVLDIVPPPAIPEQTVEDLLANHEFWQHLSREYDADLIVSGVVSFGREDASEFKDVDVVSSTSGQKVRRTTFVTQEQFDYNIDLFFIDGPTGTLRFRDRLRRTALYEGSQNDPYAAFYDLADSLAADVLAVVTPTKRDDVRTIFKN
jgi:hypothetical protein